MTADRALHARALAAATSLTRPCTHRPEEPAMTDQRSENMTENGSGSGGCSAALNIRGEHFWCDGTAPHVGLAHSSRDAEAIWFGEHEAAEATAAWAAADPEGAR